VEVDLEGQYNFTPLEDHTVSVGGNVRFIHVGMDTQSSEDLIYPGEPYDEELAGLFLIDRWDVAERVTIEAQARGDYYSETEADWSGRLTGLYALDAKKHHTVRLSAAKAFRSPLASLRKTTTARVALAPGIFAFNVLRPADDLENEETWSVEAGYVALLAEDITLRANGYYQRFADLIGYRVLPDPLALGRAFFQPDNIDGADSYGGEIELEYRHELGRLSAWYAYNGFDTDEHDQSIRAYGPAPHKVGVGARVFVLKGVTVNANYRYSDATPGLSTTLSSANVIHRLDLGLAKDFADGKVQGMIGVHDVFNQTQDPHFTIGQVTAHEAPGRTFFARLQIEL
jgi:outer membrane receptor protein involved in Fe transport